VLDEITEKEIPKVLENQNVQEQEQHVPQNPTSVVRISCAYRCMGTNISIISWWISLLCYFY
jgi:hypothetical protein